MHRFSAALRDSVTNVILSLGILCVVAVGIEKYVCASRPKAQMTNGKGTLAKLFGRGVVENSGLLERGSIRSKAALARIAMEGTLAVAIGLSLDVPTDHENKELWWVRNRDVWVRDGGDDTRRVPRTLAARAAKWSGLLRLRHQCDRPQGFDVKPGSPLASETVLRGAAD